MPFTFQRSSRIPEVVTVEPKRFGDDRGWFAETFKKSEFSGFGLPTDFVQDNHSRSIQRGIIRGLHCQNDPFAQGKLLRCVVGEVWNVCVDARVGSPTFLRWEPVRLTAQTGLMVWVPPGFLNGFCTVTEVAEVEYKVTAEYSATHDRAVRWDDPDIAVNWPHERPLLSPKDAGAPRFRDAGINYRWRPPP